ncbi:MAG: glutathione ABC transporter substrate-binding protein [Bacillota bacterium]|nr:glutathione ABC transporter substrate-binding protein [Bacillota bacterium]
MYSLRRAGLLAALLAAAVALFAGSALAQRQLVIVSGTDAVLLDAHYITDSPSATVVEHIVETLLELTPDGDIVPKLAESYEVSPDGRVWTLYLRRGIAFHDGTPFNAEAVKYNIERIINPANAVTFSFLLNAVKEVRVVDEYTVQLITEEPFAPMIAHLTHSATGIQSPAAIERYGEDYSRNPVGTGPFMFKEWIPGERITLVRNPNYWGEPAQVDEVVFRVVPEDSARMLMVQTGEAHVAVRVPPEMVSVLERDPNITVVRTPSVRVIYVALNNYQRPDGPPNPFADVRVRQAVNYAVDNKAINEFILGGVGRPLDAPIAPGVFGYQPIFQYEYNPQKARQLLAEAGYPNGFRTQLYSPSGRYLKDIEVAEAVQAQLAEVGIIADIVTMEWGTYLQVTNQPPEQNPAPMMLLGWGTVTGDADYGLYPLFHSSQWVPAGSSRSFYSNPAVDALLELGRMNPNPEVRLATYREAMNLIMQDAPWLFLHAEVQLTAIRNEVEGVVIHPTERVMAHHARFK